MLTLLYSAWVERYFDMRVLAAHLRRLMLKDKTLKQMQELQLAK